MVSLGSPPAMETCNDLLRLQGKKGRVDGLFATLDVRFCVRACVRACVCMYVCVRVYLCVEMEVVILI